MHHETVGDVQNIVAEIVVSEAHALVLVFRSRFRNIVLMKVLRHAF